MEVSQLCSTSVLRDELRGRVSRKALRILEVSSQNRKYSQKRIAESVKCSVRYVRKVLSGHAKQAAQAAEKGAASNRKWYEIIANNHLASVSAAIFASESTANTTDLLNPSKFRDLTEVRLVRHFLQTVKARPTRTSTRPWISAAAIFPPWPAGASWARKDPFLHEFKKGFCKQI